LVTQIVTGGGRARFIAADLTDPADVARLIEQSGPLEVLVNNAGFSAWAPTENLDPADFEAMFTLNVAVPFTVVAGFAPGMAERGRGAIINVSSMAAQRGLPGGTAYGASKAAEPPSTAAEYSRRVQPPSTAPEYSSPRSPGQRGGPRPTCTRPGATELFSTVAATTLLNRAANPAEIADVIAFLASDRAS
jgi:NAD(P)-dependent dehydrogenase (short-subunit alcohol dehydrogenase family)